MSRDRKIELFTSKEDTERDQRERNVRSGAVINFNIILRIAVEVIFMLPVLLYKSVKNLFKKSKSVNGKICLVTGTGRGLGRELAIKLATLGATVVCVDIRENANNETVQMITKTGGKAYGYTCNLAKHDEVIKLAEKVQKEVGRVFLLLNNAGLIMVHIGGKWPTEEVTSMFNVNTMSHYWMINAFLPAMKKHNEGHIVNVISISSFFPMPLVSLYGATKAAADYMLRALRMELNLNKNNKIVVSGVYPSVVNTSPDIEYLYAKGNLGMLQVEETAELTIEGILYDKKTIVVPGYLNFIMNCGKLLPEFLILKLYIILNICANFPTDEYKENMPFYEIIDKCT